MAEPLALILREQFHEPSQQRETATLGMWIFISTEIMLFGGVGEGILFSMILRNRAGSFSAEYHRPVVLAGLYWHFVDIIWVFLFAIFYIEGLHLNKW